MNKYIGARAERAGFDHSLTGRADCKDGAEGTPAGLAIAGSIPDAPFPAPTGSREE